MQLASCIVIKNKIKKGQNQDKISSTFDLCEFESYKPQVYPPKKRTGKARLEVGEAEMQELIKRTGYSLQQVREWYNQFSRNRKPKHLT